MPRLAEPAQTCDTCHRLLEATRFGFSNKLTRVRKTTCSDCLRTQHESATQSAISNSQPAMLSRRVIPVKMARQSTSPVSPVRQEISPVSPPRSPASEISLETISRQLTLITSQLTRIEAGLSEILDR